MNFNPLELIQMGQNPQQVVLNYLEAQMRGTPLGDNLLTLAKQNKTAEIEQIVRNIYSQKGLDYDKEFSAFKKQIGIR